MKKIIAILLAAVLTASLILSCGAAFKDEKSISADFAEAVAAMSDKGIISGFSDGSFQPKGTLTRAQAAKIICCMLVGADKVDTVSAAPSGFTDVPASNWASKFIDYCAEKKIVSGVGSGKFNPNGFLTTCAFGKMLLMAYGHDAEKDGLTGAKWVIGVQKALKAGSYNYKISTADEPMSREAACRMAYNFLLSDEIAKTDPARYTEDSVDLKDASKLKLLGRAQMTKSGVVCDYPGSGFELTLECKGTMNIAFTASEKAYYVTEIDGVAQERAFLTNAATSTKAAVFIRPGVHTIRVVRDSEIATTAGNRTTITALKVANVPSTAAATPANNLYIEFVGDSITAGCGTLGTNSTAWADATHSATHSYAYVTAGIMGADFSMVAKGGIGIYTKSGNQTMKEMYVAQNVFQDAGTKYSFNRKPNVIICALGTNDTPADETDTKFYTDMMAFAKTLRQYNGSSCKIVFLHGMMSDKHAETFKKLVSDLGGAAKGYYDLPGYHGTHGVPAAGASTGHPDVEDSEKNAEVLAKFLKTIL